jgi:hypothetical protein
MSEKFKLPEIDGREGFFIGEQVFLPLSNNTFDIATITQFEGGCAILAVLNKPNVYPKIELTKLRQMQEEHRAKKLNIRVDTDNLN